MAWPPALVVKTVQIRIVGPDDNPTPGVGRVIFDIPTELRDPTDNVIIGPIPDITATLDQNGEATIVLPACNTPAINPINWTYRVRVQTDVWRKEFRLFIPYDAAEPINFANTAQVVDPPAQVDYALAAHVHNQYVPYSLADAKGDLIVATADGVFTRLPVGANSQVLTANALTPTGLEWVSGGAGGTGRFRGVWAGATAYDAGDSVLDANGDLWGTPNGVNPDIPPSVLTDWFVGGLTNVDLPDQTDYQMVATMTVSQEVRMAAITWDRIAGQISAPHELRVFNVTAGFPNGTTTPVASTFTVNEIGVGKKAAPLIADVLPANTYRLSLLTGTGSEGGYAYTPNFFAGGPITVGAVTISAGGFVAGFAGVGVVTSPNNYYCAVAPRWWQPQPGWLLLARHTPAVIGIARTFNYPAVP